MSALRYCLIFTACALATARADLTLVQQVEGAGPVRRVTIKLKGDKARIEISPELTTIIDNKNGEILNLMNSQKKVMRMSAEKSKAIAELVTKHSKDPSAAIESSKLTATGKKETMNGYDVEEYVRQSASMKETYWIAPKYPDGVEILKQLQSIAPTAWNQVAKGVFDFRDFPGLPLRTKVKTDHGEITSTFVSIKQDSLDEAEFSVPKDYQELKIPNLQDMLSDMQAAPNKP